MSAWGWLRRALDADDRMVNGPAGGTQWPRRPLLGGCPTCDLDMSLAIPTFCTDPYHRLAQRPYQPRRPSLATRRYGDGNTIHSTGHLDVETLDGRVVAVWYRCQPLPFSQTDVLDDRADEMDLMYEVGLNMRIAAIDIVDLPPKEN